MTLIAPPGRVLERAIEKDERALLRILRPVALHGELLRLAQELDAVALRMYGSNIHAWYVGTCSSRYGTSTHEEPVKGRGSSSLASRTRGEMRGTRARRRVAHDGRL